MSFYRLSQYFHTLPKAVSYTVEGSLSWGGECSEVTSHGPHPLTLSPDAFARGWLFYLYVTVCYRYAVLPFSCPLMNFLYSFPLKILKKHFMPKLSFNLPQEMPKNWDFFFLIFEFFLLFLSFNPLSFFVDGQKQPCCTCTWSTRNYWDSKFTRLLF